MRTLTAFVLSSAFCAGLFLTWAGPPLICQPYEIGNAASLPWVHSGEAGWKAGWDNPDPNYDPRHLASDTLKILDSGAPVVVRMETLRRAVIYGSRDHAAATGLLTALRARTDSPQAAAAAYLDYGYAVQTMRQMLWVYKEDLTKGADGRAMVEKAVAMEPDSAEMHFAAAMVARDRRLPGYDGHAAKALAANSDALLAANAPSHLK